MSKRRRRGEGSLYWSQARQRWIAEVTVGYDGRGRRITRKASGTTKTQARDKLKEMTRDLDDGLAIAPHNYTVADAVTSWLDSGPSGDAPATVAKHRSLAKTHILPSIGARKLRELTADDVDRWLAAEAKGLSADSLRQVRSILRRAITRAQARDKVKRNVVLLCDLPAADRDGRPSKSLTLAQAAAVIDAAEGTPMYAYIALSILVGARTEELRALIWDHVVAYDEDAGRWRPVTEAGWDYDQFAIHVWRSVRAGGKTKTRKSRRSLRLPQRCVKALVFHHALQDRQRQAAGSSWQDHGLVFASAKGTARNRNNVLRSFRAVVAKTTTLTAADWTPREMRHSFVSILSDSGVPVDAIAQLVGHAGGSKVTETVYLKQIRPVLLGGAEAMDRIFTSADSAAVSLNSNSA